MQRHGFMTGICIGLVLTMLWWPSVGAAGGEPAKPTLTPQAAETQTAADRIETISPWFASMRPVMQSIFGNDALFIDISGSPAPLAGQEWSGISSESDPCEIFVAGFRSFIDADANSEVVESEVEELNDLISEMEIGISDQPKNRLPRIPTDVDGASGTGGLALLYVTGATGSAIIEGFIVHLDQLGFEFTRIVPMRTLTDDEAMKRWNEGGEVAASWWKTVRCAAKALAITVLIAACLACSVNCLGLNPLSCACAISACCAIINRIRNAVMDCSDADWTKIPIVDQFFGVIEWVCTLGEALGPLIGGTIEH